MKIRRSHIVALSGISSALSIISIVLACYVEPLTISLMVLSAVFLMLPLTKGYWLGSLIAYVVASIVSFFIVNINALPFILFFGLYVPIQWLLDFKLSNKIKNKWLRLTIFWIIKIAFFEIVICACWFLMQTVIAEMHIFGHSITYLIISLGLLPIFIVYDILMHCVYINVKHNIESKIEDNNNSIEPQDEDIIIDNQPFSEIKGINEKDSEVNHNNSNDNEENKSKENDNEENKSE